MRTLSLPMLALMLATGAHALGCASVEPAEDAVDLGDLDGKDDGIANLAMTLDSAQDIELRFRGTAPFTISVAQPNTPSANRAVLELSLTHPDGTTSRSNGAAEPTLRVERQGETGQYTLTITNLSVVPAEIVVNVRPRPTGPGQAFVRETVPHGGVAWRQHALLQFAGGDVRLIVDDYFTGSAAYGELKALTRDGTATWDTQYLVTQNFYQLFADHVAVDTSSDGCVAYSAYTSALRLKCGAVDRVIAASMHGGLAMTHTNSAKHFVYWVLSGSARLRWQRVDADVGSAEQIHALPAGSALQYGASSVAVDGAGNVHVAFVVFEQTANNVTRHNRAIHYAVRRGGTWSTQIVETDRSRIVEADAVSIAIAGGRPVIAYHLRAARSLRLATIQPSGAITRTTLLAASPQNVPDELTGDDVGQAVALRVDGSGRLHLAYQRRLATDPDNFGIAVARINGTTLADNVLLPPWGGYCAFNSKRYGLGFLIASDGRQFVSGQTSPGGCNSSAYFAAR